MTTTVEGLQPSVLKWARESQGYSVEEVANHLKRNNSDIISWEEGKTSPTYSQLEDLAYTFFKRPLAVFFLPQPPVEPSIKKEFRTLPTSDLEELDADTRYRVRMGHSFQMAIRELNDAGNIGGRQINHDIVATVTGDVRGIAKIIRNYLDIPINIQISWKSDDDALKFWRTAIENAGVFVFKHTFKQKSISGFCLLEDRFPIIYLNNSTAKTRQIFSMMHELAHLLLHINGISKFDSSYIERLPQEQKQIEIFCNALAAEILIPSQDFAIQIVDLDQTDDETIQILANRYRVSRESILRRLLDHDRVSSSDYQKRSSKWSDEMKSSGSGGNYYATQSGYLSERFQRMVFRKHYNGQLNIEQVADYLNVKTKSVAVLESLLIKKEQID